MQTALRAFHGKPEIKSFYLERLETHREFDQIVQGLGYDPETKRGCAIGCTLHNYDHAQYEKELGIPRILARLIDGIFEGLPVYDSREFPLQVLAATKPGADLSKVWPRFAVWLLVGPDARGGVKKLATPSGQTAIQRVADLYQAEIDGTSISGAEWVEARRAAADAAAAYADAADAADADAAADAAYAADAAAAADAADAAAYAADAAAAAYADAAHGLARQQQRDYLLELLTNAPVPA